VHSAAGPTCRPGPRGAAWESQPQASSRQTVHAHVAIADRCAELNIRERGVGPH
jgi:hypothetical protein